MSSNDETPTGSAKPKNSQTSFNKYNKDSRSESPAPSRDVATSARRKHKKNIKSEQPVRINMIVETDELLMLNRESQQTEYKGIVRMPQNGENYTLEGQHRRYYPDCEYHFPFTRPWQRMVYDGIQNKYFSRQAKNWRCLAIYLAGFLLFFLTVNMTMFHHLADRLNMATPVIKMSQPYLSFAPVGTKPAHKLIEYNPDNATDIQTMRKKLHDFLLKHGRAKGQIKRFGPCQEDNNFGYDTQQPCVFLKVNRLLGFHTKPYKHSEDVIRDKLAHNDYASLDMLLRIRVNETERKDRIWLTCTSWPNKRAVVEYYPEPAFKTRYVDADQFTDIKLYNEKITFQGKSDMNRLVALKIKHLQLNENNRFNCKMWAFNIGHSHSHVGQVHFYIRIKKTNSILDKNQGINV
ncbi:sodium/potassium-transporting ATPase subunit beta-1 [Drosophila grimshawi]|uniref:sodium/potassium-transporting ATPase subunit beta-1 n=1 Tax=Drosophila grimshawi TaxID=7222 RepID=UPI0013EF1F5D|nr:sodium/potassium-transporting ATPase subunit beta-1 [Drosophila grimshawi]